MSGVGPEPSGQPWEASPCATSWQCQPAFPGTSLAAIWLVKVSGGHLLGRVSLAPGKAHVKCPPAIPCPAPSHHPRGSLCPATPHCALPYREEAVRKFTGQAAPAEVMEVLCRERACFQQAAEPLQPQARALLALQWGLLGPHK